MGVLLPFTHEVFIDVFRVYNAAIWPAQVVAYLLGGTILLLVLCPTTAGTGSEVSGASVLTDTDADRKLGFGHPNMRAQHALVDPVLTHGLPAGPTAHSGVDALAQAIGACTVRNSSALSVAFGLEACHHVAHSLREAVADGSDAEARRRGLLIGRVGRGTFVRGSGSLVATTAVGEEGIADLSQNIPPRIEPDLPALALSSTLTEISASHDADALLQYQDNAGMELHREAAAAWVSARVPGPDPARLVVTNGAQHAISVLLGSTPLARAHAQSSPGARRRV